MRIGIGYDIHRLVPGRKLVIGGLKIEFPLGLLGHSDGDVLLHAVCDACLGAAGLGDIGEHFPDTDPRFKGADSAVLLQEVVRLVTGKGLKPHNLDCIVYAEKPKLGGLKRQMRDRLAGLLGLGEADVNVKAKTMEGLGRIGGEEAIAAHAVVSLEERRP
jgi:2-C-methyl-D-erythritol 2,4-cyclodiphosphate synthase